MRIWDEARSEGAIKNNLDATLEGNEAGLVGYWNFNNDSGTTATDLTSNGNDGSLQEGASFTESNSGVVTIDEGETSANIAIEAIDNDIAAGEKTVTVTLQEDSTAGATFGEALSLDGTNDWVEIPHSDSLSLPNTFTIETWVNPAQAKTTWQPLITKEANNGEERNYGLFIRPNSLRVHASFMDTNRNWELLNSETPLNQNEWNHLALTYDGSTLKLYVNGQLDANESTSGTPFQSDHPVKIGKEISVFTPFNGQIDEVRIWDEARSEAEIQDNSNITLEGNEAGLVGYWNFNNDSGTTATDLTSNGNDGSLQEGAFFTESNRIEDSIPAEATLSILDGEEAGVEFAQLSTIGTINVPSIELEVTTAYDSDTGDIGLQILSGANSYTFEDTVVYFTNGGQITIPAGTTLSDSSETTVAAGTGGEAIDSGETSSTNLALLDVEIITYNEGETTSDVTANLQVKLTQEPASGETITVTLKDANGNDTTSFDFDSSNWNEYQQTDANTFLELTANNNGEVAITADITSDANNDSNSIDLSLSTETVAAPLGDDNTGNDPLVVTTEGERIEFTVTQALVLNTISTTDVTVELELFNSSADYTINAGEIISFNNEVQAEVTAETALTLGEPVEVPVTITSFGTGILEEETSLIVNDNDETNPDEISLIVNDNDETDGSIYSEDFSGFPDTTPIDPLQFLVTIIPENETGSIVKDPDEATLAVRLTSQPEGGDAVLDLSISDSDEGEFSSNEGQTESLTFTTDNWNEYQEVTIRGKDDDDEDGNTTYKLQIKGDENNADPNYQGFLDSLSVTNQDNETDTDESLEINNANEPPYIASLSADSTTVEESGTVTITIGLNQGAPTGGLNV